jgi:repressor LexA
MTRVQRETLDFIADFIERNGFPPSIKEISRAFGVLSTNTVNGRLLALIRDGLITRRPRMARSITLTQLGLEKTGRLSPDRIRTSINRTVSSEGGHCPQPAVGSPEKENER